MANEFWSGVAVNVQSSLATAVSITGITKAFPGVVTHSGSDPTDGDYVLLITSGMTQVNLRVFKVANKSVGSFELSGEDTTNFGTFTSGTFQVITFGTSLSTVTDVSPSGGDPVTKDTTTIHDRQQIEVPVLTSAVSFGMTSKFSPGDTALDALKSASDNLEQRAVQLVFRSGAKCVFYGYVSFPYIPTGSAQDLVTSPLSFSVSAPVTVYAS